MNIEEIKQKYEELEELKSKLFDSFGVSEDEDLRMNDFDFDFYGDVWKKTKNFIRIAETEEKLNEGFYEELLLYTDFYNQTMYKSEESTLCIGEVNAEGILIVLDNSKEIQ